MRRTLIASLLFLAQLVVGQVAPTKAINAILDGTSYDAGTYRLFGTYWALHYYCLYPQFTNHIYSGSRSGASWQNQRQNKQMYLYFPLFYSWNGMNSTNLAVYLSSDNGGSSSTNTTYGWGLDLAKAPTNFWDGTGDHDYSNTITAKIGNWFVGGIPNDSSDGDQGAVNRDLACIQLMQGLYGVNLTGLWNPLMDHGWRADLLRAGILKVLGFYSGGHPYPAGHLAMAINIHREMHSETNVGSAFIDWQSLTAVTNNAAVVSISKSSNVITFTLKWNRMAPPYDWPDGTHTNNCLPAFSAMSDLATAYYWRLGATNMPATGTYTMECNDEFLFQATAAELQDGGNLWTNFNGPVGRQRMLMLDYYRDREGANHVTLEDTHGAGDPGVNGWEDDIRLQSQTQGARDDLHLTGVGIYNQVKNTITNMWQFDNRLTVAAQQVTYTYRLTWTPPPPSRLRIFKR